MVTPERRAQIGMIFFLAAETMFFAGLICAYWVLRAQVNPWPPVHQPRLPVMVTGINTMVLLGSGFAIYFAERAVRAGCQLCLAGWLGLTLIGGLLFLSIQGYEWVRLIQFGLTTIKNIYGGIFYIVVGAHTLHLVAALIVLLVVSIRVAQHRYSSERHSGLTVCRIYWTFVVLVWPVIYVTLYLL